MGNEIDQRLIKELEDLPKPEHPEYDFIQFARFFPKRALQKLESEHDIRTCEYTKIIRPKCASDARFKLLLKVYYEDEGSDEEK